MRAERLTLPALAGLGVALGVAACSGGEDGGSDAPPSCQILWASPGAGPDLYDVYLVEMSRDAWTTSGERFFSYDEGVFGMFYDDFHEPSGDYGSRSVATGGSFLLTTSLSSAPTPGDPVGFVDTAGQAYFGLDGSGEVGAAVLASGGKASFGGEWSDASGAPVEGTGSASIAVGGTTLELGSFIRYAQCYDGSSSAGASRTTRGRMPVPRFASP